MKIQYGSSVISFTVTYSNRKTLGITVKPDGQVEIVAPWDTPDNVIRQKVHKRASWILKQQYYFQSFGEQTPERRFISGESHLYMGRQYLLRVSIGKRNDIHFHGRSFEIVCTSKEKAKDIMKAWYKERAKIKFAEIAEPIIQRFKKYNVEPSSLYIQEMDNRWGSCTRKGKIILNTELIKAPKPCIEYVIIHELCHLLHPAHTQAFYHLLNREMPAWERWKNKLEKLMR